MSQIVPGESAGHVMLESPQHALDWREIWLTIDETTEAWFESVSPAPYPPNRRIHYVGANNTFVFTNNGSFPTQYSQISFQWKTTGLGDHWVLNLLIPPSAAIAVYYLNDGTTGQTDVPPVGTYDAYPGYPNPPGAPATVTATYP